MAATSGRNAGSISRRPFLSSVVETEGLSSATMSKQQLVIRRNSHHILGHEGVGKNSRSSSGVDIFDITLFLRGGHSNGHTDGEVREGLSTEGLVEDAHFGTYLAAMYGVTIDDKRRIPVVVGGTLTDALRTARSKARLLVVFVPASDPKKMKRKSSSTTKTYDETAIESLLSLEVAKASEKRAIKKSKKKEQKQVPEHTGEKWGSYVLWSAMPSTTEAVSALKRLKAKRPVGKGGGKKGTGDSPILLVAYPAKTLDSSGRLKITPRVLSQHHCNPPPSAESMAAWLNTLRKRHAKQFAAMQHDVRETRLLQERMEGYRSSMEDDRDRERREQEEEEARKAKERAERERRERLEQRRNELRASLPEEPGSDEPNVMTVALRFPDGRHGRRRFGDDTDMNVVFNWVDATFGMEREKIVLSTMNGRQNFTFREEDDEGEMITLKGAGLGRLTGFRVTEIKEESQGEEETADTADEKEGDT